MRPKPKPKPTIQQRRVWDLALIISGVFAFIPVWLFLRYQLIFSLSPLPVPPPIPSHSNSRLLPFWYWNHRSIYPERYTDESCVRFPEVSQLQYAASSWQLLKADNGSVYVYGAYYDDRFEEAMVRILIYTDLHPVPELLCQLWFPDTNEPQTETAEAMYAWFPGWGGHYKGVNEPYILSCRCRGHISGKKIAPIAVSVVTAPCSEATNVLNVQNVPFNNPLNYKERVSRRKRTSIAVCLKWLNYKDDVSVRVVEWMELVKHLGAEKVYIYIIRLHPYTRRVLKYYEDNGFAVITELSQPPTVSGLKLSRLNRDFRWYKGELLPLNDCLYRSIGQHDWLAPIDLDEIIVPASGHTWVDLINNETAVAAIELDGLPYDAIQFSKHFKDGAQKHLEVLANTHILSRSWRSNSHSMMDSSIKSLFNVSSVMAMHNQYPLYCMGGCRNRYINKKTGRILHFKRKSRKYKKNCEEEDIFNGWRAPVLKEIKDFFY